MVPSNALAAVEAAPEGPSAQIPLNPKVEATLPAQIEPPSKLTVMRVDWAEAAEHCDDAQTFVTNLFGV